MPSKILDCADVGTCGMLSVITSLEFFQHYFSEMGHRDLLVTQNLSQAIKQQTLHYLTRSVRRRAATSKRGYRPSGFGSKHFSDKPTTQASGARGRYFSRRVPRLGITSR